MLLAHGTQPASVFPATDRNVKQIYYLIKFKSFAPLEDKINDDVCTYKAKVLCSFITTTVRRVREQRSRSHHKGATSRVRAGNQRYSVLCHCQLGQDIPI